MSNKILSHIGLKIPLAAVIFLFFALLINRINFSPNSIFMEVISQEDDVYQLFYDKGRGFQEEDSIKTDVKKGENNIKFFQIPDGKFNSIRIDPGTKQGDIIIKSIKFIHYFNGLSLKITLYKFSPEDITKSFSPTDSMTSLTVKDRLLHVTSKGTDPAFIYKGNLENIYSTISKAITYKRLLLYIPSLVLSFIFSILLNLLLVTLNLNEPVSRKIGYFREFCVFLWQMVKDRRIIFELTKKDFQTRYLGSYLGILWAFVNPTVNILIMWFVFQVGFKSQPVDNFPFILWLICGMMPWFFFSEGLNSATGSILDNKYLVNKVVFRVSILPVIRILSALFIHLFFIVIIFLMFLVYGYKPDIYTLQVIYYLFAAIILLLGLSWITSSIVIFIRDLSQVISVILQFFFWLTPIFWSLKMIPKKMLWFFKINPVYYIVEGYRDTFIYKIWFWEHPYLTIYYWALTITLFVLGALIFRKLRPHYADVL
jgi:lipopolysaccharide transport system permease protein/teichoic acid transport system permease protein